MKKLKKLLYLLSINERRHTILILVTTLIMALIDMLGVASIMPFIAVLMKPDIIETNYFLKATFEITTSIGIETNQEFLFFLGIIVFLFLIISLLFRAMTTYLQLRFTHHLEFSIGKRLVENYLHQPYSWFLNRNSAEIGKTILSEVGFVIGNGINPLVSIISQFIVVLTLVVLLMVVDPWLTIIVFCVLGLAYSFIFILLKNFLSNIGKQRVKANEGRYLSVIEAFGAAKEIKVGNLEETYTQRFSKPAKNYSIYQALASATSTLPRFVIEAIAFGGLILILLYLMNKSDNLNTALPIISLYAFAGYRLMPALQNIYSASSSLRYLGPALDKLHNDIRSLKSINFDNKKNKIISLKKAITLSNIDYHYPNTSKSIIKNIDLKIPAHTNVGIVGTTGSGKTTIVDIILGLLEPQQGTLEVDGQIINQFNNKIWRKSIGYVPQQIYLSDNTIAANIAFGLNSENINHLAVQRAAKIANLHQFVFNELPAKYNTIIGERGIRLSGGQRQRIGIARALYFNPQVLIFDEATSALDNLTEQAIMETLNNLDKEITTITVAHRLQTVKECKIIFFIENGKLKDQGNFDELSKKNKKFRDMAGMD